MFEEKNRESIPEVQLNFPQVDIFTLLTFKIRSNTSPIDKCYDFLSDQGNVFSKCSSNAVNLFHTRGSIYF